MNGLPSAFVSFDCRDALAGMATGNRPAPRSLTDRRLWRVLASAATVDLPAAAGYSWAFLRGKRVRGWNGLSALANRHPRWLARWRGMHRATLQAGLQRLVADRQPAPVRLAAVIAGAANDPLANARTRHNLVEVLGDALVTVAAEAGTIAALSQSQWSWLLILRPGDTIDPAFRDLAPLLNADSTGTTAWFWDSGPVEAPVIKPDWDPVLDSALDLLAGSLIVSRKLFDTVCAVAPPGLDLAGLAAALAAAARTLPKGPGHLPALLGTGAAAIPTRPAAMPIVHDKLPPVSIIVLTRDRSDLVVALFTWLDQLEYPGLVERIVVDNGSTEPELLRYLTAGRAQGRLRWLRRPGPFNFAALNNSAVAEATGDLVCLLNNDVVPLDHTWLARMASRATDPTVGAVGAMLTYPDGSIQHAGVALGIGAAAGHVQRGVDPEQPQWRNWHALSRRVEAVTAACLVVRKAAFESVGGFDQARFPVAFNDVDLCLRLQQTGLHNVYEAGARLVHHESLSRGSDAAPRNAARFATELAALRQRWTTDTRRDPYWSPLFSRSSEQCLLVP